MIDLGTRFRIWRRELWRPWWGVVTGILALAANWDRIAGWFGYIDRYGIGNVIQRIDSRTWLILWLSLTVVVILERVYRLAVNRDGLSAQLNKVRTDQELSDLLSDKHDHAVHELLNKPPTTQDEFDAWLKAEAEFTKSVLDIMRQRGCTKQEWRHVHTLGVIPMLPLNPNPAIAHQLSMLVVRMGRIADIAGKYGS